MGAKRIAGITVEIGGDTTKLTALKSAAEQATMGITSDAMSTVNGQSANTMDTLSNLAKQMGSETAFSASECAEALNYLALAGYDTQQVCDTLPTVLNLAAAGGIDLASALFAVLSANPIGLVVAAIAALIAIFVTLWNNCEGFRDFWINLWDAIKSVFSSALESIKTTVSGAWEAIKTAITAAWEAVKSAVTTAVTAIKETVTAIWESIKEAVIGIMGQLKDAVSSVADTIRSFLHFSVPDEGPLADYESWMPDFMSGLAKGIEKSRGAVRAAIDNVAEDLTLTPTVADTTNGLNAMIDGGQTQVDSGSAGCTDSDVGARLDAVYEVMTRYLPRLANRQIVLDSGTLVGELSDGMNRTLGRSYL
jgi:phage-related protein